MNNINTTERLIELSQQFLVPLRMGEGFNNEKFEALCTAIKEFATEWKEKDVIPKSAACLFVDAYTAMVASSDLYPAQALHIKEKADLLNDLIKSCCE